MYVRRAFIGLISVVVMFSALGGVFALAANRLHDRDTHGGKDTIVSAWWPSCTEDDGTSTEGYPCLWDAGKHGNGHGQSFISAGPDGPVIYVRVLG